MALGNALKRLRAQSGWTQRDLADKSGVSVQLIRLIEQQRHTNPTITTLQKLAQAFGVSVEELSTVT